MAANFSPEFVAWYSSLNREYVALKKMLLGKGKTVPDWGQEITKTAVFEYRNEIVRLQPRLKELGDNLGNWEDPFEKQIDEMRAIAHG